MVSLPCLKPGILIPDLYPSGDEIPWWFSLVRSFLLLWKESLFVWRCIPVIPVPGMLRQEDFEFKACLGYFMKPTLFQKQTKDTF